MLYTHTHTHNTKYGCSNFCWGYVKPIYTQCYYTHAKINQYRPFTLHTHFGVVVVFFSFFLNLYLCALSLFRCVHILFFLLFTIRRHYYCYYIFVFLIKTSSSFLSSCIFFFSLHSIHSNANRRMNGTTNALNIYFAKKRQQQILVDECFCCKWIIESNPGFILRIVWGISNFSLFRNCLADIWVSVAYMAFDRIRMIDTRYIQNHRN